MFCVFCRWLWTRTEALGEGRFRSQLQVRAAVALHAGRYTCRAAEWETRACASVRLHVRRPPAVLVAPMASTLRRVRMPSGRDAKA